ncbi:MAG: serine/threonine protein kinase [Polyangiaceae bacterium]|nr:serine/threonine protein kinase [Polyangiaceae bacterium]
MAVTTSIPQGTVLSGKYRVGRELGRGGMAAVYEAENIDIGKRVAIKVLAGHLTTSRTVVERFLREARAVAAIRSPHICDVFDAASLEDGSPYLVLELLEGESLYDKMYRERQLSVEVTLAIVLQVCRGLARAHAAQIVHRDLKPENIYLVTDEDGLMLVKILDFGLAKFYEAPESTRTGKKAARLTRDGAVFGTPVYMSPEQVRGQAAADHRADLWALACITYECFTGTTVWSTDEGVAMTFAQIASAPVPDPGKYRPDLPASFVAWFRRALDRDIAKRHQTIQEFADALAASFGLQAPGGGTDAALVKRLAQRASDPSAPGASLPGDAPEAPLPTFSRAGPTQTGAVHPTPTPVPAPAPARGSRWRWVAALGLLAAAAGGVAVWRTRGAGGESDPGTATSSGSAEPSTEPSGTPSPSASGSEKPRLGYELGHAWLPRVREAQSLLAAREYDKALELLRKTFDESKHGMLRNLADQAKVARDLKVAGAACEVTGLSRPRRYDLLDPSPRPSSGSAPALALGPKGVVVAWTDDHTGPERAYAAVLDDDLRNTAAAVEITPEGQAVKGPALLASDGRIVTTYWEAAGNAPGVYVRWLGPDAVIESAPVLVSKPEPGTYMPSTIARPGGGFLVAYAAQVEADSIDLFYRALGPKLEPLGEPVRLTDFVNRARIAGRVSGTALATRQNRIHFAYGFAREPLLQVRYQAVAADTAAPGLEGGATGDRTLTSELLLNTGSTRAVEPSVACNDDGCFVAWHGMRTGAAVAFIDPENPEVKWHRDFTGAHPTLAVSPKGEIVLAWYEGNRLSFATVGRQGIGAALRVANVVGDQPPPAVLPGARPGQWYLAWRDFEASRPEPYLLRLQCQ